MDHIAPQAPLSMGFPRQEYWSGLPFPSSRDLPNPGIKLASPALAGRFFTTGPPGKPSGIFATTRDCFSINNRQNFRTAILFLVTSLILVIHDNATHLRSTHHVFHVSPKGPLGLRRLSVCLHCRRPGFDPWVGKIPWRRKWHPTPVLLPGKSHGWKSLVGYSPWSHKESNTTERLHFHFSLKAATIINSNSQMKRQQTLAWRGSDPCEGKVELGQRGLPGTGPAPPAGQPYLHVMSASPTWAHMGSTPGFPPSSGAWLTLTLLSPTCMNVGHWDLHMAHHQWVENQAGLLWFSWRIYSTCFALPGAMISASFNFFFDIRDAK